MSMKVPRAAGLAAVAGARAPALPGCGGSATPEHGGRAWSEALNSGDNEAAAALFATDAEFVAGDYRKTLRTHQQAVALNAGLPWCGPIVKLRANGNGNEIIAQFALNPRKSACDGQVGEHGSISFVIRSGKIVFFDQIGA